MAFIFASDTQHFNTNSVNYTHYYDYIFPSHSKNLESRFIHKYYTSFLLSTIVF
jgi:hypothetical protein